MKKIKQIAMSLVLMMTVLSGSAGMIVAGANTAGAAGCSGGSTIFPRWYDGLCEDGKIKSPASFKGGDDKTGIGKFITIIAINIVTILLTVVGYVSLAFIIWGGIKYMISGDNASGTGAAKKTILNAIIGLVLSIMSVAIVRLVAGAIG